MASPDNQLNQAGTEKPAPPGLNLENHENLGETMRSKAQEVLVVGPNTPPSNEPEAKDPPTREQLIDKLGLRDQYENRADHMVHLISKEIFKLGKPIPTLEATLNSFTTSQLEFATTLQEPTLLLVPETSFVAKVKAFDAVKTMKEQVDTYVNEIFTKADSGSEEITGWKAVVVDGAKRMKVKKGDDVDLTYAERIRNRKAARKPNERVMDRHECAMLMLEAQRKGVTIDKFGRNGYSHTLLDDEQALPNSGVTLAGWYDALRQLSFDVRNSENITDYTRFRSSVGGDVIL